MQASFWASQPEDFAYGIDGQPAQSSSSLPQPADHNPAYRGHRDIDQQHKRPLAHNSLVRT